jgi:glycerol-3-phosphate dehydrogenase
VPLLGADGYRALWNSRSGLAARSGFGVERIEHLIGRYGSLVTEVLRLAEHRPELAEPIPGAEKYLLAEAYYAASHEGALHLRDVLCRRTHIAIEAADGGEQAAPHVASVVGAALGWDSATITRELEQYLSQARAERVSAGLTQQSGDADARAVRGG